MLRKSPSWQDSGILGHAAGTLRLCSYPSGFREAGETHQCWARSRLAGIASPRLQNGRAFASRRGAAPLSPRRQARTAVKPIAIALRCGSVTLNRRLRRSKSAPVMKLRKLVSSRSPRPTAIHSIWEKLECSQSSAAEQPAPTTEFLSFGQILALWRNSSSARLSPPRLFCVPNLEYKLRQFVVVTIVRPNLSGPLS